MGERERGRERDRGKRRGMWGERRREKEIEPPELELCLLLAMVKCSPSECQEDWVQNPSTL